MERLTFDGNFCDIAQCRELPCPHGGSCTQRKVWEKLKAYEDLGLAPEECKRALNAVSIVRTAGYKTRERVWETREAIQKLPAAEEPMDWISVKDRLPKPEAEVLAVCVRNGYRFICPVIYENGTTLTQDSIWNWYELDNYGTYSEENDDYFVPEGWWENRRFTPDDVYNNPVDCAVTHWMPLPEPPKGARMDGDSDAKEN